MNLFKDIPAGDNLPEEINVVVDIPSGSHNKYEYNEEEGSYIAEELHSEVNECRVSKSHFSTIGLIHGYLPSKDHTLPLKPYILNHLYWE